MYTKTEREYIINYFIDFISRHEIMIKFFCMFYDVFPFVSFQKRCYMRKCKKIMFGFKKK